MAFGHPLQDDSKVDWKKTYRDLCSVLSRLKAMILKNAKPEIIEKHSQANSSAYRNSLSLVQMLQICKSERNVFFVNFAILSYSDHWG